MLRPLVVALLVANAVFAAWTSGWLVPLARPPHLAEREPERLAAQVDPQRLRVAPAATGAADASAPGPAGGAGGDAAAAAGAPPDAGDAAADTAGPGASGDGRSAGAAAGAGLAGAAAGPAVDGTAAGPAVAPAAATACLESLPLTAADADAGARALAVGGVPAARWQRVAAAPVQAPWLLYAGPFVDLSARRAVLAQWRRLGLAVDTLDAPAPGAPGLVLSRHGSRGAAEVALSALPDVVAALARVVAAPGGGPPLALRIPAADAALLARLRTLAPPWDAAFRPCAVAALR